MNKHRVEVKTKEKKDITVRFGSAVRSQRRSIGISQEELAHRADLHRTYITDIERGVRNLSLVNIEKIAKALNISLTKLFLIVEKVS